MTPTDALLPTLTVLGSSGGGGGGGGDSDSDSGGGVGIGDKQIN